MDIVDVRYVVSELRIPMYALFSVAYTWKYNEFAETHLDLIAFNDKHIVPDYVKEFIYELGRDKTQAVQEHDAQTGL